MLSPVFPSVLSELRGLKNIVTFVPFNKKISLQNLFWLGGFGFVSGFGALLRRHVLSRLQIEDRHHVHVSTRRRRRHGRRKRYDRLDDAR